MVSTKTCKICEFGCGYGTFTLAAAGMVAGTVSALDIEPEMVRLVDLKCRAAGIANVRATVRDFVNEGTGIPDDSIDADLLFNILHYEEPVALMREALRVLKPGGRLAVIHWNHDPTTPRGPALESAQGQSSALPGEKRTVSPSGGERFDLPPYHYGLLFWKLFG